MGFRLLFAPRRYLQDSIASVYVIHHPPHVIPPGDIFSSSTGVLSHVVCPCKHISGVDTAFCASLVLLSVDVRCVSQGVRGRETMVAPLHQHVSIG